MKNINILLLLITFSMLNFTAFSQRTKDEDALLKNMHSISSHELFEFVKELCSEKYGGRLTGTAGYDSVANWVGNRFQEWGIKPVGDNETYLQWFDNPYTEVTGEGRVTLHIDANEDKIYKHYDYITEYMPGSTSDSGKVTGEVVYVGYGITAPELGYDDYENIDVEGKIILMEPEVPLNPGDDPEEFKKWEPYSRHQYKLKNAADHGAVGMIYNYGPIANPNNAFIEGFIHSHVGDTVVNDLFAGTGKNHENTLARIEKDLKPQSFNTGKSITIKNHTKHYPDGTGSNVIGFIEGEDPELKDEAIIISAHLDHVGYCHEMVPGANDNASGVAVLLGVAKALSQNDINLKRSIVFLAFGAEEQGIVGSGVYIDNPAFPLDKTAALLNLDGVGVGDKFGAVAGKNYPDIFEKVEQANEKYIHRDIHPSEYLNITRPRLDAARFMSEGISSLSFYSYGKSAPYHQPGDNISVITPETLEDMTKLIYFSVINLSNK
ncbi:MAG: M20/M25/M40 family metallo-hydrolase [Bacteroidales bacterium]